MSKDPKYDELSRDELEITIYAVPTEKAGCIILMMTIAGAYALWHLVGMAFRTTGRMFGL